MCCKGCKKFWSVVCFCSKKQSRISTLILLLLTVIGTSLAIYFPLRDIHSYNTSNYWKTKKLQIKNNSLKIICQIEEVIKIKTNKTQEWKRYKYLINPIYQNVNFTNNSFYIYCLNETLSFITPLRVWEGDVWDEGDEKPCYVRCNQTNTQVNFLKQSYYQEFDLSTEGFESIRVTCVIGLLFFISLGCCIYRRNDDKFVNSDYTSHTDIELTEN